MLTIDIGNTRIKWGEWQDGQLIVAGETKYKKPSIAIALSDTFADTHEPDAVWVSCVAGAEVEQALSEWLDQHWSVKPDFLRTIRELGGVQNMYEDPSEHGVDRWAALLGARQLHKQAVCVIDAGTAVTIDLMDAAGVHRGGRIMPGLEMMRTALLEKTDGIRSIDGECPGFAINTADAVTSGTLHMLRAALTEVCEAAKQRLGENMTIIITGGMAEKMLPFLDMPDIHHEPYLVLYGLYYASQQ